MAQRKQTGDNFQPIGLSAAFGGMAVDKTLGTQGQFYDEEHMDFRTEPSDLTVLPGTREISSGIVTDLVLAMDQINSGKRYAIGDVGKIYTVSTANVWAQLGTLGQASGAGLTYRADLDNIYFSGQSKLGRIFHATDVQTLQTDFFTEGVSAFAGCTKTGGAQTYSLTAAISEAAVDTRNFTSDIDPIRQIGVYVVTKGTGDWTLTLHDDADNVLGTVTVLNAALNNGAINYFRFTSPIRIIPAIPGSEGTTPVGGMTYHYHLTSSNATGTVQTTTASSLADCDMELWADALITTQNALHPMGNFLSMTMIGNGPYLATYEPLQDKPTTSDFKRHRLVFPPGFEVCSIAQKNLMTVIGCEKRSSTGVFQEGALFFWDGVATGYNDWWPVPEGSPESLFASNNTVYLIVNGVLERIQGTDEPVKIRTLRNTSGDYSGAEDITHVYPNMMTVRHGILLMGYPSITTNQKIKHGVYSYGVISREYPLSFGYDYTMSTNTKYNTGTNNLRIGMIKNYGSELYISWRDDSHTPSYGVDIVDNTSDPAPNFELSLLHYDDERPYANKNVGNIITTFDPLPAGVEIRIRYRIDQDDDWTYSTDTAGEGDTYLVAPVDRRFLKLQSAVEGTVGSITPNISSFFQWIDPLPYERPVGGGI